MYLASLDIELHALNALACFCSPSAKGSEDRQEVLIHHDLLADQGRRGLRDIDASPRHQISQTPCGVFHRACRGRQAGSGEGGSFQGGSCAMGTSSCILCIGHTTSTYFFSLARLSPSSFPFSISYGTMADETKRSTSSHSLCIGRISVYHLPYCRRHQALQMDCARQRPIHL